MVTPTTETLTENTVSDEKSPITITIRAGKGNIVSYDENGLLGEISRQRYDLEIKIAPGNRIIEISTEQVAGKGIKTIGKIRSGNTLRRTIVVEEGRQGFYTTPGQNDLRFAIISDDVQHVEYCQVGLVSQDGLIWVIAQTKASFDLCRYDDGGLCALGSVRPELIKAIAETNLIRKAELPLRSEVKPLPAVKEPELNNHGEGVVVWYDQVRQAGAIRVNWEGKSREVKVHWRYCPILNGRHFLEEGQLVRVGALSDVKDTRSSFKFEAHTISVRN